MTCDGWPAATQPGTGDAFRKANPVVSPVFGAIVERAKVWAEPQRFCLRYVPAAAKAVAPTEPPSGKVGGGPRESSRLE